MSLTLQDSAEPESHWHMTNSENFSLGISRYFESCREECLSRYGKQAAATHIGSLSVYMSNMFSVNVNSDKLNRVSLRKSKKLKTLWWPDNSELLTFRTTW